MLLNGCKRTCRKGLAAITAFVDRQNETATIERLRDHGLLSIGRHTYGMPRISMYRGSESGVFIGAFCSISPEVEIIAGGIHPTDWVSTYPFRAQWRLPLAFEDGMPRTKGSIEIGNDVWIGTGATILSGVRIGDGAVVGARALVAGDVRPYAIVGGVPAREIGRRFPDEQVDQLLKIAWWRWDDARIAEALSLLSSADITLFLERYAPSDG